MAVKTKTKTEPPVTFTIKNRSYWAIIAERFSKNKMSVFCLAVIIILILVAVFGPMFSPYTYEDLDYTALYAKPSAKHWLGCDDGGRDMMTLLMYSLRNALLIGFGACIIELCIGLIIGGLAGYFGGRIDNILSRFIDIMFGFPTFLFNLILVLVMGRSLFTIFLAIGLTSWAGMARLVRSQVMTIKQSDFVEAGKALGASNWRMITKYILPNCIGPLIISLSMSVPAAMLAESGMSLIGLGVMPPIPSWGGLISSGTRFILSYPHLIIYPSLSFAITILAFSYLGDGLRDAFDPKDNK